MTLAGTTALLLAMLPMAAVAQSEAGARTVALVVDNDLIAVRGAGAPPDFDYTHGVRASVAWARAPDWVRRLLGRPSACARAEARRAGCVSASVTFGQEIYTPRRDAPEPLPGERPYAGWLSASAGVSLVSPGRVRALDAELGVTGPPSLAEQVQGGIHRLLHNQPQLGWGRQLRTAPGFVLRYGEVRRLERAIGGSSLVAGAVRWGAAAGTTVAVLSLGAEGTIGRRGALPWTPAAPEVEQPARLYALGGYRQDVVLRNVFVDGRDASGRADRRSLVGEVTLGVGYRRRSLALEYRYIARGREYAAQPSAHAYGSVRVVVHRY